MHFDDENILQDYLTRLLAMQDEREDWLGEDDLQAVARDLGLSDEDLARIDATAAAHRQRGQRFSQHDAWGDAIAEYRQAVALRPFDVPLVHALAVAYASRYQDTRTAEDRQTAERYTRRCIELDPNHTPSYELLTALKQPLAEAPATPPAPRSAALAIAVGAALLAVGVAALVFLNTGSTEAPPLPPTPPTAPGAPGQARSSEQPLPVRLLDDAAPARGLRLDVQRSVLNDYDSTFSYTLHATLHNEADELHRLRLKMALLDADGEAHRITYVDVRSDHQPYLRPGDTAPIAALIYERQPAPSVQAIQLSVVVVEREPAATAYDAAPPLPVAWAFSQPAHLDVDIVERESRIRSGIGTRLHFLTLAAHNLGPRSVQHLRLEVTWFDAQDNVVASERTYVVPSSGPAMRAGETWVARAIGTFPAGEAAPFARYAVTVAEAE